MHNQRSKRRNARAKVLGWLAGFLALQGMLAIALDHPRAFLRNPNYVAKYIRLAHLRREPDRPVVVVLGSSRTLFGLRPDRVPAPLAADGCVPLVFNFGVPGCGPLGQLLYLKSLLRQGIRPDGIVLEVLPALLAWEPGANPNVRPLAFTWQDLATLSQFADRPADIYRAWFEARLMPWFVYRFHVMNRYLPAWLPAQDRDDIGWKSIDHWGWAALPERFKRPGTIDGVRAQFQSAQQAFEVAATNARALRELIEVCQGHGIPTVLLLMPVGPQFQSWYTAQSQERLQAFLAQLHAEFDIAVVDARNWVEQEALFLDSHHLLPGGATVFSERFGQEVLPLLAAGRSASRR